MLYGVGPGSTRRSQSFDDAMGASEIVGALVRIVFGAEGQQPAVVAVGGLGVQHLAAPVDGGGELLLPLLGSAHRTIQPHGHRAGDDGLRVCVYLDADAAHASGEHADAALGQAQHTGGGSAFHVRGMDSRRVSSPTPRS